MKKLLIGLIILMVVSCSRFDRNAQREEVQKMHPDAMVIHKVGERLEYIVVTKTEVRYVDRGYPASDFLIYKIENK